MAAQSEFLPGVDRRSSGEQGRTYLTRVQLETGAPPSVPVKPVTVSSSPEIAMVRFCVRSSPIWECCSFDLDANRFCRLHRPVRAKGVELP